MTEEIGKEATSELETADHEHVDLEFVAIVVQRILDCIIVSVIAQLSNAEHN